MALLPVGNQINFYDDQNFNLDINQVYTDFITAIDNVRSYSNTSAISDNIAKNLFKSGDTTLSKLKQQRTVSSSSPQESRAHAFFRIIGFPVVSAGGNQIYNPGLDIVYSNGTTLRTIGAGVSPVKLTIAANPIPGFRQLSLQREAYFQQFLSVFSLGATIDAGCLDLSVSARLNNDTIFSVPLGNTDPFDVSLSSSAYVADFTSRVGNHQEDLSQYIDANGTLPNPANLFSKRNHIIKPFIVDPVIDFLVNDASNLIAVPFVPDKTCLMVKDGVFVSRPIIEQVIAARFGNTDGTGTLGSADVFIVNYINSVASIQNNFIINQLSKNQYGITEQIQADKYINIIRVMCQALYQAQQDLHIAQELYYYVPVPSSMGPESGSSSQGVFISSSITPDFITTADQSIIDAQIRVTLNAINIQTASVNGTPDPGGFAFDNIQNSTFSPDSSSSLGNISQDTLTKLNLSRGKYLTKANTALQTTEIILGEFSGLGLADIVAVMGALWVMPQESLLGFLDPDALARMNDTLGLSESSPGINKAMSDFIMNVQSFYSLMDKIYADLEQNNLA